MQEKHVQSYCVGIVYFSVEKRKKGRPFFGRKILFRQGKQNIIFRNGVPEIYTLGASTVLKKNPSHFDHETEIISG